MDSVIREADCRATLSQLKPGPDRTILYQLSEINECGDLSKNKSMIEKNSDIVSMPFKVKGEPGNSNIEWNEATNILKTVKPIKTFKELVNLIKSIDKSLAKASFNVLNQLIDEMSSDQKETFFNEILPWILSSALKLPDLISPPIPILKQKMNHSLFFNQQQLASLLSNAFLCTFEKPRNKKINHFTFNQLFSDTSAKTMKRKLEKLKCLVNYFRRMAIDKKPNGVVSFHRRWVDEKDLPEWSKSTDKLIDLVICPKGSIDKEGKGMLQVDFAHKMVGGKTLTFGLVQEEILFLTSPELIVSMLFSEQMLDNEVIVITGAEQFNQYSGYQDTFQFIGDHFDSTKFDSWGRRFTKLVAMDASYFHYSRVWTQFSQKSIDRELTKAYVAFLENENEVTKGGNKSAIATGNWGCGVYRGDPRLKSLIQSIAASICHRDIVYFTFNDRRLSDMKKVVSCLGSANLTTGELYNCLKDYGDYISSQGSKKDAESIFDFICRKYSK